MEPIPSSPELQELARQLAGPDPLELPRRADQLRRELHGRHAWYAVIAHVGAVSSASRCPVCGGRPRPGAVWSQVVPAATAGTVRLDSPLPSAVTDLHVLPGPLGTAREPLVAVAQAMQTLSAASSTSSIRLTFQLGSASDLIVGIDAEAAAAGHTGPGAAERERTILQGLRAAGLRVVSDGTHPVFHPTRGPREGQRWERFWEAAAEAGLTGHASVLHGPDVSAAGVMGQLVGIADLQRRTKVFASVAAVPAGNDPRLTGGLADLKVLAACRLALPEVAHMRVLVDTSDLKMAQLALACGADDLEGHLALTVRDRRADFEADDLTLPELERWLREEGFTPVRRNGAYEGP